MITIIKYFLIAVIDSGYFHKISFIFKWIAMKKGLQGDLRKPACMDVAGFAFSCPPGYRFSRDSKKSRVPLLWRRGFLAYGKAQ